MCDNIHVLPTPIIAWKRNYRTGEVSCVIGDIFKIFQAAVADIHRELQIYLNQLNGTSTFGQ